MRLVRLPLPHCDFKITPPPPEARQLVMLTRGGSIGEVDLDRIVVASQ